MEWKLVKFHENLKKIAISLHVQNYDDFSWILGCKTTLKSMLLAASFAKADFVKILVFPLVKSMFFMFGPIKIHTKVKCKTRSNKKVMQKSNFM